MSEQLKPCPFCGHAEPVVIHVCSASDFWWEVGCPGEECFTSKRGDTEAAAIAAWNRRAPPPHPLDQTTFTEFEKITTHPAWPLAWPPESHLRAEDGEE